MLPRTARGTGNGATGLCMNAGTGKIRQVAAFRGAPPGKAGLPPQGADPSAIDLDLVNGVKDTRDTVGGVDTSYAKPASSFFASGESWLPVILLRFALWVVPATGRAQRGSDRTCFFCHGRAGKATR
jgi:hypothetical protein